jgi:hypothetical protein
MVFMGVFREVESMYGRRGPAGFGLPKPLKRPAQARARFTVLAIYHAFVRIWQRDGRDRRLFVLRMSIGGIIRSRAESRRLAWPRLSNSRP